MSSPTALNYSAVQNIVVMGLGYVGESIANLAAGAGLPVVGLDVDASRATRACTSRWCATDDPAVLDAAGLVLVCVPTPLDRCGAPDRSAVLAAAAAIREHASPSTRVCLESTVDPEFARVGFAAACGLERDCVAHAPERINPGPAGPHPRFIPRVVGGCTPTATRWAAEFYRSLGLEVFETTAEIAALSKLLENTQRLVNIALMGEFAALCHARGVDVDDVVDAAATKRHGYTSYRARAGAGGHCIPVDPVWLAEAALRDSIELPTVTAALVSNQHRPGAIADVLLEHAPNSTRILVIGAAYKPDVPDLRESPALRIVERLVDNGRVVRVCDPLTNGMPGYPHVPLDASSLAWADAILIITVHDCVPLERLRSFDGPVFDASGELRTRLPGIASRI